MKHLHSKKGVTLAELVVVLALLAIVSTMVTSFCILINGYNGVNRSRAAITERLAQTEQIVADFILAHDSAGKEISITPTAITVTDTQTAQTFTLTVNEGLITAQLPTETRTQRAAELSSVTFEGLTGESAHPLLCCTVTYQEPNLKGNGKVVKQVFAVATKMLH